MANKTFVESKIESKVKQLFVCSLVSVVVDALALVLLLASGVVDLVMIIALSLLLAVGVTQCIFALNSNYRFSYAKVIVIVQILLYLAFVLALALVASMGDMVEGGKYEIKYAVSIIVYWAIIRAVQIVSTVATLIYASVEPKKSGSIVALVFTGIFAVSSLVFGIGLCSNGFYGQGAFNKVVVYEYDETTQSYNAKRFIGNGNSVVIPATFNGQPVTSISYELFTLDEVSSVTIHATNFVISEQDTAKLAKPVNNKNITAPKSMANTLRNFFFDAGRAHHNPSLFNLGNGIRINDLRQSERAIYYNYTRDENVLVGGEVLPITIVNKGEAFNPESLYLDYDYAVNCDDTTASDLLWAVENNNGYILSGYNEIENTTINENKVVDIEFEKVVKLNIADDNDTVYSFPTTFTKTAGSSFKLVTADTVQNAMAQAPTREGFDLLWSADGLNGDNFAELIASASANEEITLTPTWLLKSPTVDSLVLNRVGGSGAIVYGDAFTITPQSVVAPSSDFTLSYAWEKANANCGTSQTYSHSFANPTDAGQYKLTITASSPNTSLTSSVSKSVSVTVAPRSLQLLWTTSSQYEYDGTAKNISASAMTTINGDTVPVILSKDSILNAGTYTINASLPNEWQDKYAIANAYKSRTYKITPKTLLVSWANTDLTYNGSAQAPTPSVTPIGSDQAQVEVTSKYTNAGTYTFSARFIANQEDASNYTLDASSSSLQLTIKKQVVSITMDDTALIYNGTVQRPTGSVVGKIGNDSITLNYTVLTDGKSAGEHTVTVKLDNNAFVNYSLSGGEQSFNHDYSIAKKQLSASWSNTNFTYNGNEQKPTLSASEVIDGDNLNLTYTGIGTNAGEYTVVATLGNSNYAFGGSESVSKDYVIGKKEISVELQNSRFIYNGAKQLPSLVVVGAVAGQTVRINLSEQTDLISAGEHTVTAKIDASDYQNYCYSGEVDSVALEFSIEQMELTLVWSNDEIPTASASESVEINYTYYDASDLTTPISEPTSAGNYVVVASVNDDNYKLSEETKSRQFTITGGDGE